MIVTTRHLFTIRGYSRRAGFCRGGSRRWFEAHGLDWRDFVAHGIDEACLTATGDGLALALVKWAHRCAAQEADNGR